MAKRFVLLFESGGVEELVELLLAFAVERPAVGVASLTIGLSFLCFLVTGSIVPIAAGLLISLWAHWRISRRGVITLDLSDGPVPRRKR